MPLEGFPIIELARPDDEPEISKSSELLLKKLVDLSPVTPMLRG